jgi:hypothetical protein
MVLLGSFQSDFRIHTAQGFGAAIFTMGYRGSSKSVASVKFNAKEAIPRIGPRPGHGLQSMIQWSSVRKGQGIASRGTYRLSKETLKI